MIVLLSDFLTAGDLRRAFNRLHSAGLEILALQLLSAAELRPEVDADLRLVDAETEEFVDVSSAETLLDLYQDHLEGMQDELRQLCAGRGGRFATLDADIPFERLLFDDLRRVGWLR